MLRTAERETDPGRSRGGVSAVLRLGFCLSGILGLLMTAASFGGLVFPMGKVCLLAAVLLTGLWLLYVFLPAAFPFAFAGAGAVLLVLFFRMRTPLMEQLTQAGTRFVSGNGGQAVRADELAWVLTVLVVILFFGMEFLLKVHFVLYVLVTAILLLTPVFNLSAGLLPVFLLVLFQITFWADHLTAAGRGREGLKPEERERLAGRSILAAAAVMAAAFLAAIPLTKANSEKLYQAALDVQSFFSRHFEDFFPSQEKKDSSGINKGNNTADDGLVMELHADGMPEETLFLKEFSGGDYTGDSWDAADDAALYGEIASNFGMSEEDVAAAFSHLYYTTQVRRQENVTSDALTETLRKEGISPMPPYFSAAVSAEVTPEGMGEYRYVFLEESRLTGRDSEGPEGRAEELEHLEAEYGRISPAYYTRVPVSRVPRLAQLVKENPMEGVNEITSFILYTLQSHAEYTRSPGLAPANEDIVEYFLFDSGKGYCQHFASAAVLMYRLYGIPARYVTGYLVTPDSFAEQDDGTASAGVIGRQAHSWAEIWLPDYGWVPVDVTPSSVSDFRSSYPGYDAETMAEIFEEHGWELYQGEDIPAETGQELPKETETPAEPPSESGEESAPVTTEVPVPASPDETQTQPAETSRPEMEEPDSAGSRGAGRSVLILIAAAAAVTAAILLLRRRRDRMLTALRRMDAGTVFRRMINMLHFSGILTEYSGGEADFAARLAEEFSGIPEEETAEMIAAVTKERYGPVPLEREEASQVRNLYRCIAGQAEGRLGFFRRLLFRYLYVYG